MTGVVGVGVGGVTAAVGVGVGGMTRAVDVGWWRCDRGSRCRVLAV